MFERFYRGEAARDYRVPGAGLGLAIAQTIMQRLNGRITVDSQPGQGVTFTLWLE
jgi:signal transduction histidine kinase